MFVLVSRETLQNFVTKFQLSQLNSAQKHLQFFDTFHDELLQKGYYLVKNESRLELRGLDSRLVATEENVADFKFFWDFKTSNFNEQLKEIIEYRALMAKDSISANVTSFLATDSGGKGVLRVFVYEFDDKIAIEVVTIKGYGNYYQAAKEFLASSTQILSLFDFVKKEPRIKSKPKLSAQMPSREAINLLLSDIYKNMRNQEVGIVKNIDSEFLHYYRVYLRKARAILSQFKTVFTEHELETLSGGLREIGKATNHARDLDVYWLKVREYAEVLESGDFEPFLEFLKTNSEIEYTKLGKFLKSSHYKKTMVDFSKIIKANPTKAENAKLETQVLVKIRLKKLFKRILKDGKNLDSNSADAGFHALRIDCKKIRYILEFFESIFEKEKISEAIKLIKNLQTILGTYQDLSVQQLKIVGFADEMIKDTKILKSSPLISIGRLVGDLQREQKGCKEQFLDSFNDLLKSQNRELFKGLFRKDKDENDSNL